MDVYEKEIEYLKTRLIRINNYSSIRNSKNLPFDPSFLSNQILNEDDKYQVFFHQLKQEFKRIHSLVSEANLILNEMQQKIIYNVILQIPVSYLKPSERNINNLCEIAIQVKQGDSILQIWNIEKFEYKFNDMKDIYQKWKTSKNFKQTNLFFDEQSESLIGVANIYLKALFYNLKFDYIVSIINTRGEISGSLHVVLDQTESSSMRNLSDFQINSTTQGSMSDGISADIDEQSLSNSQPSLDDEGIDELSALSNGKNDQITVKFAIKEVRDLPQTNAEHIICRYTFINPKLDQTIISIKSSTNDFEQNSRIFSFDHENEYTFSINDNFLSTCFESAVSIEVWYQYKSKIQSINTIENDNIIQIREISKCWKDVKRHIQFSVAIHELDATGQWGPVDVNVQEQILSGGVYRLKQGQSKRLITELRVLPRSNPMPLSIHAIRSVEIGSIDTRKIDASCQLDSYQDEDLQDLKCEWLDLIEKRKLYLESQVNLINQQTNKTPNDIQRETMLLEKFARLAEERNIAMFPPAGSGIPGAPAAWIPPANIEMHRPLIFLNLNSDNVDIAGLEAILNEENKTKMFELPLIQNASDEIRAVAVWNPSIHESTALNQITPQDTFIYLIVKITVLLSEPVQMEVILRKRIAVTINKTEGWWTGKTFKNLLGYKTYKRTGVVYEIVSNIPKNLFHDIEDENKTDCQCISQDSIEKYLRYASTIDSILLLDRLRQEVLLAETSAKQQTIRKAISAPNITPYKKHPHIFHSPVNSRRENIDIRNEPILSLGQSNLNDSTPSMLERSIFIEEQQLQYIQTPTFQIKHIIDLDDNKQLDDENTLELKYPIKPSQIISKNNEEFAIGCRVIVNTGRSICDKKGIIRFIGEFSIGKGIWYGIELDEPVGKNNGSHDGHIYFECPNNYGIFVRYDKIKLVN